MNIKSYSGVVAGVVASTTVLVTPAQAANIQVRELAVRPGDGNLELALSLAPESANLSGEKPQISTTQKDRVLIAEIANARLDLGNGQDIFSQDNPLPGIERIEVMESAPGNVKIVALGEVAAPKGEILSQDNNSILLNVTTSTADTTEMAQVTEPSTVIEPTLLAQSAPSNNNQNNFLQPTAPIPPFLPRASAPPVGDISISTIDTTLPRYVDLRTNAIVPRLVLKQAPAEDVMALLARTAGMNLVVSDDISDSTVSLDLENEPVQEVFNYVLMMADLKAVMKDRTIFVGKNLPGAINPSITRTFRLNQIKVEQARAYLETGSTGITRTRSVTANAGTGIAPSVATTVSSSINFGEEGGTSTGESSSTEGETETQGRLQSLLSQLEIRTDERLNSITLTGEPKIVEIASTMLQQLDARKRQVALNVKIIDVRLDGNRSIASDIKFLLDDRVGFDADNGIILSPNGEARDILGRGPLFVPNVGGIDILGFGNPDIESGRTNLAGSLVAGLLEQGTGKILADPTLIIQENETSELRLTQEVIANITRTEEEDDNGDSTITVEAEIDEVGLIVPITVDSIDDNGFVSLNISAEVSDVGDEREFVFDGNGAIISLKRTSLLNSGLVRLRDNQTLILAGAINEEDFVNTSKVPILGDIPIIGSLFRSTTRENIRRELLFIITPQIIDESDGATWGYDYQPSETVREMLDNARFPTR
ncbi:secretin N-terminal domain-containing protein [Picosynechococcus sp. NKBG042902]|uniref:secretin N-terminal domain-containing protein n=1 Tax=Picosynechococcus sp. NKBG042902 TaxID=490193 RepID=UPI0006941520|nr:secretin N-terminal domain-containing protein [Picosynechococcus sp. NKBG042902]